MVAPALVMSWAIRLHRDKWAELSTSDAALDMDWVSHLFQDSLLVLNTQTPFNF